MLRRWQAMQTQRWIQNFERKAYPHAFSEPKLPRDYVEAFLKRATLLNEMMRNQIDDYIHNLVERTYEQWRWNRHHLRTFVVLDYPLVVLETIFRKEAIPKIRAVRAGMYPGPAEINACAVRSPMGTDVVFFSEGLFSFLWDLFHATADVFPPGTGPGKATKAQEQELKRLTESFRAKLGSQTYPPYDIDLIVNSNPTTNSARAHLLLSLLLIWAHELGHLFLRHHDGSNVSLREFPQGDGTSLPMAAFNVSQEQELDADMFASDVYFTYLYKGVSGFDESAFESFHYSGFELFRMLAYIELGDDNVVSPTHPPSGLRLINMQLRHQEKFKNPQTRDALATAKGRLIEKGAPRYDYSKDLGLSPLLI